MAESDLGKHSKRKGRSFYKPGPAKKMRFNRSGGLAQLSTGMQGILITTGDQEKLCVSEAYNLLNEYAEQLYGPEFVDSTGTSFQESRSVDSQEDSTSDIAADDPLDIDAAIAKEVRSLKGGEKKERRFKAINSGAKHVVFIVCRPPVDPYRLVHCILSDVASSGIRKSRFCQRILPVTMVCRASLEDIAKNATSVLEPHFHVDDTLITKFAVSYKARNNNVIKRDDVIKLLASMVTRNGDYDHIVDLNNPDLTVVVEIIKNLCCLSVVKDFHKLCKYNIHTLTDPVKTIKDTGKLSSRSSGCADASSLKTLGSTDVEQASALMTVDIGGSNKDCVEGTIETPDRSPKQGSDIGGSSKDCVEGTVETPDRSPKQGCDIGGFNKDCVEGTVETPHRSPRQGSDIGPAPGTLRLGDDPSDNKEEEDAVLPESRIEDKEKVFVDEEGSEQESAVKE